MIKNIEEYNEKVLLQKKLSLELTKLEEELIHYERIRDSDKIQEILMPGYIIDKKTGNIEFSESDYKSYGFSDKETKTVKDINKLINIMKKD